MLIDFCETRLRKNIEIYLNLLKFSCFSITFFLLLNNYSLINNILFIFLLFEPIKIFVCDVKRYRGQIPKEWKKLVRTIKILAFILTIMYSHLTSKKAMCPFPYCELDKYCISVQ